MYIWQYLIYIYHIDLAIYLSVQCSLGLACTVENSKEESHTIPYYTILKISSFQPNASKTIVDEDFGSCFQDALGRSSEITSFTELSKEGL